MPTPTSQRTKRWMLIFAFWTLVVLVYSTRGEVRGEPVTWLVSLRLAMAQRYRVGAPDPAHRPRRSLAAGPA